AGHSVDNDHQRVRRHQRGERIIGKQIESGGIEKVNFGLFPLDGGDRGGYTQLPLNLFLIMVGDGVSLIDPCKPAGGPSRKKQAGHYRSLSAVAEACNADVSDVLRLVNFHGSLRFHRHTITVDPDRLLRRAQSPPRKSDPIEALKLPLARLRDSLFRTHPISDRLCGNSPSSMPARNTTG